MANIKGKAAEGIALLLGGQRNHPVVIGVDDRRHRPMGMKPGESFQYDHQGQGTLIRNAATFIMSLDDDGNGQAPGGKMLRDAEGRETGKSEKKERFGSVRHVEKKKQDREKGGTPQKNLQTWIDAGWDYEKASVDERAEKASAPNHEDYKHEGDKVNTEIRCTKNRIEFRAGDKVVGYYDVQKDEWEHKAKTIKNDASSISHKGVQYFDNDIHVMKRVYALDGLKPGNGDWNSGTPSSGPSMADPSMAGPPIDLPPDIAAYVASKQEKADALEARLAAMEARIAELEARNAG
jgi:hypothetical protein